MTGRTFNGTPLTPGVNVDALDIGAGLAMAVRLGYDDDRAQMVATYALQRWARGEEQGADTTWVSYFRNDLSSWRAIVSAAQAGASTPVGPVVEVVTSTAVRGFNGDDFLVENVDDGEDPAARLAYWEGSRAGVPPGTILYLARVTTTTTTERIETP